MHLPAHLQQAHWPIDGGRILTRVISLPRRPTTTTTEQEKAEKLKQLVAAMDRILTKDKLTQADALQLQQLREQRKTLLATFPPIRKVVDNT